MQGVVEGTHVWELILFGLGVFVLVFLIVGQKRRIQRKRLQKKLQSMTRSEQYEYFLDLKKKRSRDETAQTLFAMSFFMNQHNSSLSGNMNSSGFSGLR